MTLIEEIQYHSQQLTKVIAAHGADSQATVGAFYRLQAAKMGLPNNIKYDWAVDETERLHQITLNATTDAGINASPLALEVRTHPKTNTLEVYHLGQLLGVLEQTDPLDETYHFMSKCAHGKITGNHYIAIGNLLNRYNQ